MCVYGGGSILWKKMWVFYLISLPLTTGMVALTLYYFAGPDVPRYVIATVGYAWFCSISVIILVPADIWTAITSHDKWGISFFWIWSYWSTFLLTWAVVPILQGYEDAGDFSVAEKLKTSAHVNLVHYLCVGSIALCGVILLIFLHRNWGGGILGFAMACSNTFGLVTGAFLLGFGLIEIPRGIWRNADWTTRQKVLSHKVAKMAVKLDDAHQKFSNAIVVAQATSKQMPRRDPLRPYMNIIDKTLAHMLSEDPSFKPQGGRLGENDMDYDTDKRTMASLRRHLKKAQEQYYRYKSQYMNHVMEALELEDTIKNYEHYSTTGWKFISSFRSDRSGKLGSVLDVIELIWRCMLRKQLQKILAVILGFMSAAILLAEATILPRGVNLSLFSILINSVGKKEMLVQVAAFVPLMYMCVCTYYSLFQIGMLTFYSFTPKQTSSVSLLMICSMIARYAPPISYNFLNLIQLDNGAKTVFEKRMGNIDDAVPFFGKGFNKIYPLIMVIYTILIGSNFFDRLVKYFGNWKIFNFLREEADDLDGFDQSGIIILQRERSWLEQGHKVGELVIPLARSFSMDMESGSSHMVSPEANTSRTSSRNGEKINDSEAMKVEQLHESTATGESNGRKYTPLKGQQTTKAAEMSSSSSSSHNAETHQDPTIETSSSSSSRIISVWDSIKTRFQNIKSNVESNKFIPLRQNQDTVTSRSDSTESLDEIFERLKRPTTSRHFDDDDDKDDLDDYATSIRRSGWTNSR